MPAWGFTFGSDIGVYFRNCWPGVLISLAALYGLTRTPLGRLTLGLRENITTCATWATAAYAQDHGVCLVIMFAGIAGGLRNLEPPEASNYVLRSSCPPTPRCSPTSAA